MSNPRDSSTPPSEMFIDSISTFGVGSAELECGWCGRLHLCPGSDCSYDVDNWKSYCDEENKKGPDKVILHYGYDCVSGREINGIVFVLDCPCNGLFRYENFIWENRATIRNYLTARVNQEYEFAEQEKSLNKLAGLEDPKLKKFF
jgi:hypothetical protein